MAYRTGHLLLLPAFLCLMPLHASALSFDYDFSIPRDLTDLGRQNLKCINDCSPAGDRVNLTKLTVWSTGRLAHLQPVHLWDDRTGKRASFTTSFSFVIGGNKTNDRGDGMAFFIGPFPPSLPSDSKGSFLGLFNPKNSNSQTVGVEFDTHRNDDSVVSDPADAVDHIGIDVNNITSKNTTTLPNLGLFGTMSANITYNADSTIMVVNLQLADGNIYRVETQVDFRAAGVPQEAAVGFSATTGDQIESHQLLSWSFMSTDPSVKRKIKLWVVLVPVSSALLAGSVAALLCIMRRRAQRKRDPIDLPVAREFSYNKLSAATGDFSEENKLGAGNFGEVYRGDLRDPRMPQVAVKKLTGQSEQTWRDYVTEIMTLGQLRHRNLVKLVGWCKDGGKQLLLVYGNEQERRRAPPRVREAADVVGEVQDRAWHRLRHRIPPHWLREPHPAPGHQAEQRDAGRRVRGQARRLRAGEAGLSRTGLPQKHVHHRELGLHGPQMHHHRHGEHRVRHVQLRGAAAGDRHRQEAGRVAGRRAPKRPRQRCQGILRQGRGPRDGRRAAERRVRQEANGACDGRRALVCPPGSPRPAGNQRCRQLALESRPSGT